MIVESIEIARRPEEVFAYLDQLERHGEWQEEIVSSKLETEGPTRVGSRATDTRRMPGGPRDISYEIVEHDPPRKTLLPRPRGAGAGGRHGHRRAAGRRVALARNAGVRPRGSRHRQAPGGGQTKQAPTILSAERAAL